MKLVKLQSVCFLFDFMRRNSDKNLKLVLKYNNTLIKADVLNSNFGHAIKKEKYDGMLLEPRQDFDSKHDFPTYVLEKWLKDNKDFQTEIQRNLLSRPDMLLPYLIAYVDKSMVDNDFEGDMSPVSNTIYNVEFLESRLKFDFLLVSDDDLEPISIITESAQN